MNRIFNLTGTILFSTALFLASLLFVPMLLGMESYAVLSSSMEPALPTGSVIYVAPISGSEDLTDEIIAFHAGGSLVAHRAIAVDPTAGIVTTKGDNNNVPDHTPVYFGDIVGTVRFHIPYLGYLFSAVSRRGGKFIVCLAIFALLMLSLPRGRRQSHGPTRRDP